MPKTGDIREDGFIWWSSRWRSPASIARIKAKAKEWKIKNAEKEGKKRREQQRRRYHEDEEFRRKKREYCAEYERKNPEWCRRKHALYYIRHNPAYGIQRAISEYRRGRIGLDGLTRLCEDACARADALCSKIDTGAGESTSDPKCTGERSQGDSGASEG